MTVYYVNDAATSPGTAPTTLAGAYDTWANALAGLTATLVPGDEVRFINNGSSYSPVGPNILDAAFSFTSSGTDWTASNRVTFRGRNSTDTADDWVTFAYTATGTDQDYFLTAQSNVEYLLIRGFIFDFTACTSTATQYVLYLFKSDPNGCAPIWMDACQFIGAPAGSLPAGPRNIFNVSSIGSGHYAGGMSYCFFDHMEGPSTSIGGTSFIGFEMHHTITYWSGLSGSSLPSVPFTLAAFTSLTHDVAFYNNTVYINWTGDGQWDGYVSWPVSGTNGNLRINNHLMWVDGQHATLPAVTGIWRGSTSSTTWSNGGTNEQGYNVYVFGSSIETTADLGTSGIYDETYDAGTDDLYDNDVREFSGSETALFADPSSTFTWQNVGDSTKFGSATTLDIVLPKDLRPISHRTDGVGGTVPGALDFTIASPPSNGSGDESSVFNGVGGRVEGIYDFTVASDGTSNQQILLCVGNNLYVDEGRRIVVPSFYDFHSPAQYTFTPYGVRVFITSTHPEQPPVTYSGISKQSSTIQGAPNLGFGVEHFSRLVGAGNPDAPSTLYASKTLDFEEWTPGADPDDPILLGITVDDGQRITGLSAAHYGRLYVFKDHSISVITGSWSSAADVARSTISTTRGSINHHVIQAVGNDIFFWSDQGCHSVLTTQKFGDVELADLSIKVRDDFKALVDPDGMPHAHSLNYTPLDLYITFFRSKGSSENDVAFVYHYSRQEWTIWETEALCSAIVREQSREPGMWLGTSGGLVNRWPGPSASASCRMASGGLSYGDMVTLKNYEEVDVLLTPHGEYEVQTSLEFMGDDGQLYNAQHSVVTQSPVTGRVLDRFILDSEHVLADKNEILLISTEGFEGGTGRSARFKITSSTSGEPLTVLGYVIRATRKSN